MDRARSAMKSRLRIRSMDLAEAGTGAVRQSGMRHLVEGVFVTLFFAVVVFAAIPMGANRDWAWSPIVVVFGALAVWHSLGLGLADGHVIRPAERRPLIVLVLCFSAVVAAGLVQISPLGPSSWGADLYASAASVLGHPVTAIVSLNADVSRAILMKIAACGAIFVMARAMCREPRRARLFLMLFIASAVVVTLYGLLMHATNGSCYVFNYSKRTDNAPPGRVFLCELSGTFVNSNSYAAYAGMASDRRLGTDVRPQAWTHRAVGYLDELGCCPMAHRYAHGLPGRVTPLVRRVALVQFTGGICSVRVGRHPAGRLASAWPLAVTSSTGVGPRCRNPCRGSARDGCRQRFLS